MRHMVFGIENEKENEGGTTKKSSEAGKVKSRPNNVRPPNKRQGTSAVVAEGEKRPTKQSGRYTYKE